MTSLYFTLIRAGNIFFQLIYYLILIRVILSWVRLAPDNKFVSVIHNLTDPIIEPVRRLSQRYNIGGMVDFSPLITLLIVQFIIHPLYNGIIGLIF